MITYIYLFTTGKYVARDGKVRTRVPLYEKGVSAHRRRALKHASSVKIERARSDVRRARVVANILKKYRGDFSEANYLFGSLKL